MKLFTFTLFFILSEISLILAGWQNPDEDYQRYLQRRRSLTKPSLPKRSTMPPYQCVESDIQNCDNDCLNTNFICLGACQVLIDPTVNINLKSNSFSTLDLFTIETCISNCGTSESNCEDCCL